MFDLTMVCYMITVKHFKINHYVVLRITGQVSYVIQKKQLSNPEKVKGNKGCLN